MKDIIKILAGAIVGIGIFLVGQGTAIQDSVGGSTGGQLVASSTTFTLTTTSQRLLATSTQRVSAVIQPTFCTSGGTVFLNDDTDIVATVANGDLVALASTTEKFSVAEGNPLTFNSVQGILDVGTCTVKVTEWKVR